MEGRSCVGNGFATCQFGSFSVPVSNITFEQQRELMLLQFEQEKRKLRVEIKSRMELEKVQQETEKMKFELQKCKFDIIRDGKLSSQLGAEVASVSGDVPPSCDMGANLHLFECITDVRGWPDVHQTLMLQCVLTGRAQEAYYALSVTDCLSYAKVK